MSVKTYPNLGIRVKKSIPDLDGPNEFDRPYPVITPHSTVPSGRGSPKEPAQEARQVNKQTHTTAPLSTSQRIFTAHPFPDSHLKDSPHDSAGRKWSGPNDTDPT